MQYKPKFINMKTKLIFTLLFIFAVSFSYASFPVKRSTTVVASTTESNISIETNEEYTVVTTPSRGRKKMVTALLLWWFAGIFAAHRWYLESPVGWNILYIITLGGIGIWAIVDVINIITENFPTL